MTHNRHGIIPVPVSFVIIYILLIRKYNIYIVLRRDRLLLPWKRAEREAERPGADPKKSGKYADVAQRMSQYPKEHCVNPWFSEVFG